MKTTSISILCSLLLFTGIRLSAQNFDKDSFKTQSGKTLDIFFVKHASLILKYDNQMIYVDPVSMFMNVEELPKADMILITHEHYDHFDANAVATLKKEDSKIILNDSSQVKLKEGIVMKNGDKINFEPDIEIEAVPAYNTTPGRDIFHPKSQGNGYLLTLDGLRIYIAGDTEAIPEMQYIIHPDIAFLPVNQPYTMTVEQAVLAAKVIKPQLLYPYHFGDTEVDEIKRVLETEAPEIEVRIKELQ